MTDLIISNNHINDHINDNMNDALFKEQNVVLKKYFGYESLKPEQYHVINSVMKNKDTIGIFATGAGKSLNFQMIYLLSGKTVIVISPLVSLILDQYKEMKNRNIDTCIFNGTIDLTEINSNKK